MESDSVTAGRAHTLKELKEKSLHWTRDRCSESVASSIHFESYSKRTMTCVGDGALPSQPTLRPRMLLASDTGRSLHLCLQV